MTVKISVSLPDHVAAYLAAQRNTSAAVAEAVEAQMTARQARRERRRRDAEAAARWMQENGYTGLDELDEHSAAITLGQGAQW